MARYWIADAAKNVLGPLGPEVLADLSAAGKLARIGLVSKEGGPWQPPSAFPEVAHLFAPPPAGARRTAELEEVQRLALTLDRMREQPLRETLGLPADASYDEVRKAYFVAARRYHPQKLPADVAPELRRAHHEVFEFLATRMIEEDRKVRARTAPPPAPAYDPEEFLGLERRQEGRVEARVKVTTASAGMFSENHTVNLSTGGLFIATERLVPLGTRLDVILDFEAEGRTLSTRGVVVWENSMERPRQPKGFGVRLTMIRADDRKFLEAWVAKVREAAEKDDEPR